MAKKNKFTLSVMERLEQEAATKTKKVETTPTPEMQTIEDPKERAVAPMPSDPAATPATPFTETLSTDLSQFLRPQSRREAKNKTFYLDTAVIDAIKMAAKKQKMAESRLVNEILASVLGVSLDD